MTRHVVGTVREVTPGGRKRVVVNGRPIVVFNLAGSFHGLFDRCPHQGAPLSEGLLIGLPESPEPGRYGYTRVGEIVRCPWHAWEFDIRTGRSYCDPARVRTRAYPVEVVQGGALDTALRADTVAVTVDDDALVVDI